MKNCDDQENNNVATLTCNKQELPSPMYLKALYSCGKDVAKGTCREDCEINKLESELMVWLCIQLNLDAFLCLGRPSFNRFKYI